MNLRPSLALVVLFTAAPLAAEPLSRAEAVRLALEANPDVKKAEENLAKLRGLVTEVRADALPEITVLGQWTRFRDPSLLNSPSFDNFPPEFIDQLRPVPATLWDGYATLKQTLWSFKVGRAIKAAKLATQSGDEEIRRVHQAVALLAVQAYNVYVLGRERVRVSGIRLEAQDAVDRLNVAKKVLDTTELNLRQARKALEMIQANYKYGAATLLDVIDAQAAQTLADSNRIQALYTHANARATLRFVMAQDPLDPLVSAPATPPATNPDPPSGREPRCARPWPARSSAGSSPPPCSP
jgi:outer membrane protein TolC